MLKQLITLLLIVVIFAGGFFYFTAASVCRIPLEYTIGVLDERFELSEAEAKAAISDAESAWEDATGLNLFTYTDDPGAFPINFLFDERQLRTNTEENLRERLDETEEVSDAVRARYDAAIAAYDRLESRYSQGEAAYGQRLAAYNAEVAKWNDAGGAPPAEFEKLEQEKTDLASDQATLNQLIVDLNAQAATINDLSERGNRIIDTFNNGVETYNDRFGESHEFTQGDYQGDKINVYQFSDQDELRLVIAHELGHALHLDHVENEASIMYFLMGEQSVQLQFTDEDLAEFGGVCGNGSVWSKISVERLFNLN